MMIHTEQFISEINEILPASGGSALLIYWLTRRARRHEDAEEKERGR